MKLKFYMRGLGVGILITTIIFSFGNKKEKLSDKEIMAKAKELGMVMVEEEDEDGLKTVLEKSLDKEKDQHDMADNGPASLTDNGTNKNTSDEENNAADPEHTDKSNDVESDINSFELAEAGSDIDPMEQTEEDNDMVDTEITDSPEQTEEGDDMTSPEPSGEDSDTEVTFTIARGMSSGQVAELLFQKGVIEDAAAFDNYIKQKGKAGVIRIGTYSLSTEADYQEILKLITG